MVPETESSEVLQGDVVPQTESSEVSQEVVDQVSESKPLSPKCATVEDDDEEEI